MSGRKHRLSAEDAQFRADFEACRTLPASFDHRSHVRLAYVYLSDNGTDAAHLLMQRALLNFIQHHNIPATKYHETITRAWIMAVRHFMELTPASASSAEFLESSPRLLDTKIMLTHYSAEVLFSADARAAFVEPNLSPIPRYSGLAE